MIYLQNKIELHQYGA